MPIFRLEGDDISNSELVIAQETNLELESHLEDWLENSPRQTLAQEDFLWIGRQTSAKDEEGTLFPDLLGVDAEGNLVIVELKRDQAPRDVVAQLLEYAAWASELSDDQIQEIAEDYFETGDESNRKQFHQVFKDVFELSDTDEIPHLNRNLRLYIVASDIPSRVARVCRFLRTSQGMDINCINVSTFETETGERLVSMEAKVGDEQFAVPNKSQKESSSPPRLPSDEPEEQIVWEAVQEFTKGDFNATFSLKGIERIVSSKYPDFNVNKVRRLIRGCCVKFPTRRNYPRGEDRYMWIGRDKYRLYDPEKDKPEDAADSVQD